MIASFIHGLKLIKPANNVNNEYNLFVANSHYTPIGKGYGEYTLDSNAAKALELTSNLPDLSGGYLRQIKAMLLLERFTTTNGDFIIATAQPSFPSNLGTPVIKEQYLEALCGKKFISYNNSGVWSNWKELNSGLIKSAAFTADATAQTIDIDPTTINEYFITLQTSSSVDIVLHNSNFFNRNIIIDINPETANYNLTWDPKIIWKNTATPPTGVDATSRISVIINVTTDNEVLGVWQIYSVI